jgi:hypothetical protein
MSLRYLTVAEAHCGEITVENRIKLASQLEMIYPQRGFIGSVNDVAFLGVYLLIISIIGQLSLFFVLIQSSVRSTNIFFICSKSLILFSIN